MTTIFVMGVVLGLATAQTGSVLLTVESHASMNGLFCLMVDMTKWQGQLS